MGADLLTWSISVPEVEGVNDALEKQLQAVERFIEGYKSLSDEEFWKGLEEVASIEDLEAYHLDWLEEGEDRRTKAVEAVQGYLNIIKENIGRPASLTGIWARDLAKITDPCSGCGLKREFYVAGELSWGDEPEGSGYQTLKAINILKADEAIRRLVKDKGAHLESGGAASLVIPAEVYTDDYYEEARFDAAKWFEEATDDEVLELARCGWGGEYASDRVAEWTANLNPSVRAVLDSTGRVRGRKMVGFECHVSEPSAMRWLAKHRPALFQKIYGGNKS